MLIVFDVQSLEIQFHNSSNNGSIALDHLLTTRPSNICKRRLILFLMY